MRDLTYKLTRVKIISMDINNMVIDVCSYQEWKFNKVDLYECGNDKNLRLINNAKDTCIQRLSEV